jgi:GH3 auxin-responsive promoter
MTDWAIAHLAAPALAWRARGRRRALEALWRQPTVAQDTALLRLVRAARDTDFGRAHGFQHIRSVADYQERVPLREYLDFRPLWAQVLEGARDVTWPGRPRYWVKTSGTTAGDKVIPVTTEALAGHRRGGWDAFLLATEQVGAAKLLGGPLLFLGGSTALAPIGADARVGDLSGLVMRRLPPGFQSRYSPGRAVADIPDWKRRVEAAATRAAGQDLRLISGMPSWLLILFERVARIRRTADGPLRNLGQCWPNLQVLIHGGVAFGPYRAVFDEWFGRPLPRVEVYPASEGFVAVQTEAGGGLTLMLDYGIFYEFVPVESLGLPRPTRHTVADVELGRSYAVVLSTPAGLFSYLLGDTVRFTARDPLRLVITGRTHHFVNAFGENVIVEEVERAILTACRRTEAEVVEFTVAPHYPSAGEPRGGHDWLVEFRMAPREPQDFARVLDETLMTLNADYRTKRRAGVGMMGPRLTALPGGTFHRWMSEAGKLGDQHKVPRVTNDRAVAEAVLRAARALASEQDWLAVGGEAPGFFAR